MTFHKKRLTIVGIDEAGRGPIAGPVTVGAFMIETRRLRELEVSEYKEARDSKQLTALSRERWLNKLKEGRRRGFFQFSYASSSALYIDRFGIVAALRRAIALSLRRLNAHPEETMVFLDGALKGPRTYPHQEVVIGGDETVLPITLASIIAKTARDRLLIRLDRFFPEYGFKRHKGYGTAEHYKKLKEHGFSSLHRRSFLQSFLTPNEL